MIRRLLRFVLVAVALVIAAPRAASADPPVELKALSSAQQVEVGEPFNVELRAVSERGGPMPSDPELRPPPGFSASGPDVSTQSIVQIFGGRTISKMGIGATWRLTASAPGHFVIAAPTVVVNGARLKSNPLTIDVVPATGKPRRNANPFLMPGGPGGFQWPFGGGGRAGEADLDDVEEAPVQGLSMDAAPDPQFFLRAVLDKQTAVVGEQVNVSFYVYHRINFEMTERHEAPLDDFVRVPLLKNPGADPPVYATAGGHKFAVRLLDRVALFPVRAGVLHTGQMQGRFAGRAIGSRVLRGSNDATVTVTEPPLAGRPAGYAVGDVGQFTLSVTVQPRRIEQGGAVAVMLKLAGTGNLPEALHVPARTGVDWLDPEKKSSIEPVGAVVSGFRTFGYVVRITDSGTVNLGKIELPYWDAAGKRYQIASVTLGAVEVSPTAPAAAPPSPGASAGGDASAPRGDPLSNLPSSRRALGAYRPRAAPWLDGAPFWWLLAAPPLLFAVSTLGVRAVRTSRAKLASARTSASTLAAVALADVDAAEKGGDGKALASAAERAVHHAIEARTGLRSRGVLIAELPAELEQRGLSAELAARARATLASCDALRFDPSASAAAIAELGAEARGVARELLRGKAQG